jgi:hypothetical protein
MVILEKPMNSPKSIARVTAFSPDPARTHLGYRAA